MKTSVVLFLLITFVTLNLKSQEEYMDQSVQDSLRKFENKKFHSALTINPLNYPVGQKPKNVILFIGDGMGTTQVMAAHTANKGELNTTNFPYTGFSLTQSADNYITDSAAGGTALACGKRTDNGIIGEDTQGNALKSLVHLSENKGLSTGVISTSAVTHATPASFVAHVSSRKKYEDIASDFTETDLEVIIGGGLHHFTKREDKQNLLEKFSKNGYTVAYTLEEVQRANVKKLIALLDTIHLPRAEARQDMLPKSVERALKILSKNDKGFFLMTEGSQIDWGGHANNTGYIISETLDMDKAVGEALAFAMRDQNTLIIITADHETGGMALMEGDFSKGKVEAAYTRDDHTGVAVPVFAYGPGAELFTGVYPNTAIFEKIVFLLNLKK